LDVVRYRLGSPLPDNLIAQVRALTDDTDISRWLEAAAQCDTLEESQSRVSGPA
jgi:hypothetical protein